MKNLFCLILLLSSVNLFSQIQLAGIKYTNYSKVKVEEGTNDQEVSFQEMDVFLNLPIKFKDQKTVLINGFRYGFIQAQTFNTPIFSLEDDTKNFHSISYDLTLLHSWNPKWTWMVKLRPTLASDFVQDVSSDDFLFLGTTMIMRRFSDKFLIGAGLAYTTQTGEPLVLPVAKLKFENRKNIIDVLFPSHIKYLRKMGATKKLHVGLQAELNGGNFNVSFSEFVASDPKSIDKLIYSRVNVGPVVNVRLAKILKLELFGGYTVNRTFKFSDFDDTEYQFNSENGPFFQIGLSLTSPKK